MSNGDSIDDPADLVVVAPTSMALEGLVDALTAHHGFRVELIAQSSAPSPDEQQAMAEAVQRPSVTGVVHLVQADGGDDRRPLGDLSEVDWVRLAEAPTWTLIETLQAVKARADTRAAVIVVVETTGMSGEVGGTAASTAGEAARAVAKSAARAWGGVGPAVQIVATDASVLTGHPRTAPTSRAANRPEPTMADLAEAIRAALNLPTATGLTTLVVDGGRTLLP